MSNNENRLEVSFTVESNLGGIDITICGNCGAALITSEIAWLHIYNCKAMHAEVGLQKEIPYMLFKLYVEWNLLKEKVAIPSELDSITEIINNLIVKVTE